jgi:hypothetical protein
MALISVSVAQAKSNGFLPKGGRESRESVILVIGKGAKVHLFREAPHLANPLFPDPINGTGLGGSRETAKCVCMDIVMGLILINKFLIWRTFDLLLLFSLDK